MSEEPKIPTNGRIYSKEMLKKAVEEYDQRKDKGLARLTHGKRTGCVNLDFSCLFTDIKEVDLSKHVLEIVKSDWWKKAHKDKSIGDEMRIE